MKGKGNGKEVVKPAAKRPRKVRSEEEELDGGSSSDSDEAVQQAVEELHDGSDSPPEVEAQPQGKRLGLNGARLTRFGQK